MATPVILKAEAGWPMENSRYYTKGDYNIHYRVDEAKGKKIAQIFMIHGFTCNTRLFDELVEIYTKNGIRCVRIDLPDFGYSTRETKETQYIPQNEMILDIMKLLDPDNEGWIVLGHSMGGSIALELKVTTGANIKGIILNTPLLMFNVPSVLGKLVTLKPMCAMMDAVMKLVGPHDLIWAIVMYLMTFNLHYTIKMDPDRFGCTWKVKDMGTGLCYMTSHTRCPDMSLLKDIDVPVQLVTGSMDLFVMPWKKRQLLKALPDTTDFHNILNGGHCLMQDKAKKTSRFALAFLKENGLL